VSACRERCLDAGEPLAGSAGSPTVWVGIAWPKPRWNREEAARSDGLPAGLAALDASEKRAGRKLAIRLFQRAERPPTGAVELLALDPRSGRSARVVELPLPELVARVRGFLDGEEIGPPIQRPTLLICTDGQHDRCCAALGRPLFDAAGAEMARRGLDVDVAQASHLGGHRFAATVLTLPAGRLYGRVDATHAAALLEAVACGRVLGAHDRGSLGRPELEQVAEVAARAHCPAAEAIDVQPAAASADPLRVPVSVRENGATRRLEVLCRRHRFESPSGCGEAPEARERWVAGAVSPV
jgi:hypothetical protein